MFKKVLIANRGEIAIRIIRSCKELGIQTVSVHSDVDEESLHVKMSDESVCIGPAQATQSYLNIQRIVSAAEITGADAIHPGYGFLSENASFVETLNKCGLKFIGPRKESMEVMGDKLRSKDFVKGLNIPILESIRLEEIDSATLKKVNKLGYPVLLKASAGGGGKGMSVVYEEANLEGTFKRLQREAYNAFGDGTIFIEKFLENPRHVEVQVLADQHGNVIHLGERDCSIQRKYQKVIEEAPCPVLNDSQRKKLWGYALEITKKIKYDSVGTIEFLYDQNEKKFYFIEMNTRIQVEHPITEQLTGVDLVSQQILIASGLKLKLKQSDIGFVGHSIECRINAEDPVTYLPSPGHVDHYHRPGGPGVRVDDFIYTGYNISPFYDSLLSKVIVSARDRDQAIKRMSRCLDEIIVGGIKTNIPMHQRILGSKEFSSGKYSTNFLNNF